MGYEFYLGNILLPVTPSSLSVKINNQNKTYNLINDSEINVLKNAGLTDIEFEFLLPNVKYPFAVYKKKFETADVFLNKIEKLKTNLESFQFIVIRTLPDKSALFSTNIKVSLESYTIKESAKENATDIVVSIKLKQYKTYGTKVYSISIGNSGDNKKVTKKTKRETSKSPAPKLKNKTYKVVKGDCLWTIAKKFYDDGSKYKLIYEANKDKIKNPNLIYPGQILIIPVADVGYKSSNSSNVNKAKSKNKINSKKVILPPAQKRGLVRVYNNTPGIKLPKAEERPAVSGGRGF